LRGREQDSAQLTEEIRPGDAKRVLGEIPRELGERGGQPRRIDAAPSLGGDPAALESMRGEVVRIAPAPRGLRADPPSGLTARCRARALTTPDVTVRDKPPTADAAGTLPEHPQMLDPLPPTRVG
jgi:hypothetical protein